MSSGEKNNCCSANTLFSFYLCQVTQSQIIIYHPLGVDTPSTLSACVFVMSTGSVIHDRVAQIYMHSQLAMLQ